MFGIHSSNVLKQNVTYFNLYESSGTQLYVYDSIFRIKFKEACHSSITLLVSQKLKSKD